MWHMPYERMAVGDEADDTPEIHAQQREAPSEDQEEPRRTPNAAEGTEGEERKMPQEEPGPTPGSAESGGLDEPSRH